MPHKNYFRFSLLLTIFFLLMIASAAFAQQEQAVQRYIAEGSRLKTAGQYTQAIEQYNQALLLNGKHDQANYLMALTYFKMGKYRECIVHCNKAINILSAFEEEAYMLKGQALIMDKKETEAISVYNKMLEEYPDNYLAYYYEATAYLNLNNLDQAEQALSKALIYRPSFADGHLLLGDIMIKKGENLKAVMALTNFLLIEPGGKRAVDVYTKLQKQLPKAFGNMSDMNMLSLATDASTGEFANASIMEAVMENGQEKSNEIEFSKNAQILLERLSNMKRESSFWWTFYVNFYNDMNYNKHLETLSYFIAQSQYAEETQQWLIANNHKVSAMIDWVNGYDR